MEQIAKELDIALVTYSMTHHTRQSAIGLPFITQREYGGETYDVSMYTMSEIIASVYENMEKSGKKEGILFLDEINCVSETLTPSMLQFLQYKTFGNHRVPDGWVIVTAGNPPEYNRSVREFDVVTLDRMKILKVEPDYEEWKLYAQQRNLHKSILTYLDIKKEDFYEIENTVDGKTYVTARGWEDLSEAIYLYEEQGFAVDETLVSQYLRNKRICGEFSSYYELFRKYRTDYRIPEILSGREDDLVRARAKQASFDERISIVGLLLEAILPQIAQNVETEINLRDLHTRLKAIRDDQTLRTVTVLLDDMIEGYMRERKEAEAGSGLDDTERRRYQYRIRFAEEAKQKIRLENAQTKEGAFGVVSALFAKRVADMRAQTADISDQLNHLFSFVETSFGDGNEMLILVTELTVNYSSARFIAEKGCEPYYRYNKKFLLYERNRKLMDELESLARHETQEDHLLV
jgi:hypothetical protein